MNKIEHLLTILSEECGEVIQITSKILRFGEDDHHPSSPQSNGQLLIKELNDILGVVELLEENGFDVTDFANFDDIEKKKSKVKHYMNYSKEIGKIE